MQKVLVSASHYDTLCKDAWKLFEENGFEVVFDPAKPFPSYTTEEIEARSDREDIVAAVIGMDDYRDEKKYQALPNLKAVAKFGVGVDNIDGELAKKYGVKALNAPGQNSNAVAELTVGFMLDVLRYVVPLHKEMEKGKWPRYMGNEIKGKTVGLLGFGAIARLVAKKLTAFDVKVLAFDLYPNEKAAAELGVTMTTREEVITKSDIVSIHIPATPETHHLFNAETIASMKDGAYLINPARGALVDLDALADALKSGKIAGAALDAFEVEPLPVDSPILECENIVLTPHTGAETVESYYNVSMTTAKDIISVLKGEEPLHCVNR
ncbi:MAG: phosphoglycerate dehydrogenase [Eubacteriales bacterium]|nr:phosphoglycerate dehydrogenase [Eubacteriales bacterium]